MNNNGFTLIELMAVLAVCAILALYAFPVFQNIALRQKINGQANNLYSLIYLARTEAIKRGAVVTICKSIDGQSCGGSWSDGWLMFSDLDQDGVIDIDDATITAGVVDKQIEINWIAFGSNNHIRLTPRGMTLSQNGTFTICPTSGDSSIARTVVVSKLARVRLPVVGKQADGDDIDCG